MHNFWIKTAILILSVAGIRIETPKGEIEFEVEKYVERRDETSPYVEKAFCQIETRSSKSQNMKRYFEISRKSYKDSLFSHLAEQLRQLGYENVSGFPKHHRALNGGSILIWKYQSSDGFRIFIKINYC